VRLDAFRPRAGGGTARETMRRADYLQRLLLAGRLDGAKDLALELAQEDDPFRGRSAAGAAVELSADDGPRSAHVSVRVSDGTLAATGRQTVEIRNVAPGVDAGGAVTGYWGVRLPFAGAVSDPSQADRAAGLHPAWQFGGGSADGASVNHAFDAPGSYDAKLTATDVV
jgi:hypothetical protein